KPTLKEREGVKHFGIDVITPDRPFSVSIFIDLYKEAKKFAEKEGAPLFIVGGTGFYLKSLLEGISDLPKLDEKSRDLISKLMKDQKSAYEELLLLDREFAQKISSNDRYRVEKGLSIYYASGLPPTQYFKKYPPKPVIESLEIYEIEIEKEVLNKKIEKRTEKMFEAGLVDEVAKLEYKYGRSHTPMKAIGIKEVLDYFDAKQSLTKTKERVIISTRQLAKRQRTFNKTQLPSHPLLAPEEIFKRVVK
ncbi:MAG: tRNA (adenosine(37)-N6)-dimethylallyltransferase MiaA, partial [Hydrogenimonas sp.]|nr:tRNA (adenosine(37)-N6)-dimethylallyltransferase MiaA [Hydrogenimonas sp.]